jgi:hypothetical protein
MGVHRPTKTSRATATGQNWPNPGLMPRSVVRSRDGHKIKI